MARVNITVPDGLLGRARAAGLNVSKLSTSALSEELDRRDKVAALDTYLRQLDVELGPVSNDEQLAAEQWANRMLGDPSHQKPGRAHRTA